MLSKGILIVYFIPSVLSWDPWRDGGEYSKFPTQCKDVEGYFRMPGERGFSCKKNCNTCFDCYCDPHGKLHPAGACTRKGCGYVNDPLDSLEHQDDSQCKDIWGKARQNGEGGFTCFKDCNICLDCFCSPHGALVHSYTCTQKTCPAVKKPLPNARPSNCEDIHGRKRYPGERDFACRKDCNTCRQCSCPSGGQLVHGTVCTRKMCRNHHQKPGCKDSKGRIRRPGEVFSCNKGCNKCSKCTCTPAGKLVYGHECTKMACLLDNEAIQKDFCYDAFGEKTFPGDGDFPCKKNCNTCTKCKCKPGGVVEIGGGCTRMACLSNECLDTRGQIRKPGTRNFSCKKHCNTCLDCQCSNQGKLIFGSKCTRKKCL